MAEVSESQAAAKEEFKPFLASCNKVGLDAPIRWVKMGWADYRRSLAISSVYGFLIMMVSYAVFFVAWKLSSFTAAIAMLSAFIFIAPVLCLGLYSVARQLKRYQHADLKKSFRHGFRPYGDLALFIIVLIVIALIWARAASLIHVFFPFGEEKDMSALLLFLGVGTFIGSLFSLLVFCVSAFSLPMIMDKKVDMITCCVSSFNAVLRNKRVMALWAALIVLFTGIGIVTLFLGFMIVIPVLGFATWHSYRETLNADVWDDRINEFATVETVKQPNN